AIGKATGREYVPYKYHGAADATDLIVIMGSAVEACREAMTVLNAKGEKTGVLAIHMYRPFSPALFAAAIPKTVTRLTILDRDKDPAAAGEGLMQDVIAALVRAKRVRQFDVIVGGRYGLSSCDFHSGHAAAVYMNARENTPMESFSV
ncbi:hypothetical protein KIPB_017166, partial [Kipferlia bialata]